MNDISGFLVLESIAAMFTILYLWSEKMYIKHKSKGYKAIYAITNGIAFIFVPYIIVKSIQLIVLLWGWE